MEMRMQLLNNTPRQWPGLIRWKALELLRLKLKLLLMSGEVKVLSITEYIWV